jgi:protein-S-isoprenylcysteine O-methyltransferase Ste14
MSRFELKIPPVIVGIALALLMWLGARSVPSPGIVLPQQQGLALGVAALGVGIAVSGVIAFRRAKTTVNPLHPEAMSALVVGGIYRATRNPMYLGMLFTLVGWAVWLGSIVPWLLLPGFVGYINQFQIIPEERVLSAMFGAGFTAYCTRVRRWL